MCLPLRHGLHLSPKVCVCVTFSRLFANIIVPFLSLACVFVKCLLFDMTILVSYVCRSNQQEHCCSKNVWYFERRSAPYATRLLPWTPAARLESVFSSICFRTLSVSTDPSASRGHVLPNEFANHPVPPGRESKGVWKFSLCSARCGCKRQSHQPVLGYVEYAWGGGVISALVFGWMVLLSMTFSFGA